MNKFDLFDEFTAKQRQRMEKSHNKYGNDWFFTDLTHEIEEEVLDLANYAYFLYYKIKLFKQGLRKT